MRLRQVARCSTFAALALDLLQGAGAAPPTASQCFDGPFNVASCCLHPALGEQCWGGGFTYETCCVQAGTMSAGEIAAIQKITDDDLTCGCTPSNSPHSDGQGAFNFCEFHRAVMLNGDLRQFYMAFTRIETGDLARCPLGAMTMLLFDTYLKLQSGNHPADLTVTPSFRWAEDVWRILMESGKVSTAAITASGWQTYFHLANIRLAMMRRQAPVKIGAEAQATGCAVQPAEATEKAALSTLTEGAQTGKLTLDTMLGLAFSIPATAKCKLGEATTSLATAYALHQRVLLPDALVDGSNEVPKIMKKADDLLRASLKDLADPLSLMVASPWPYVEHAALLSHGGQKPISVARPLDEFMSMPDNDPLRTFLEQKISSKHGPGGHYMMRLFPFREMVSDMIRFSGVPFCGLRPFMRLVAKVATEALANPRCRYAVGRSGAASAKALVTADGASTPEQLDSACELTVIEGGPHLGDCALWAAAVLQQTGARLQAVAFEPLPDASSLFRQTVIEAGMTSTVDVRTAALGEASNKTVELVYYHGHNGQACVSGDDFASYRPEEVNIVHNVPQAVLDEEVPSSWPVVDVVKLSVNGAERDTLKGARSLLSKRKICTLMMHTAKVARGRAKSEEVKKTFSTEVMSLLELGDFEVFTHHDSSNTGGPVQRATSAADLDAAFDNPEMTGQHYIMAHSRSPACAAKKKYFAASFGSGNDDGIVSITADAIGRVATEAAVGTLREVEKAAAAAGR